VSKRLGWMIAVIAVAISVAARAAEPGAEKIKALLVTGCDVSAHRWYETSPELRRILEETGRFTVYISEEPGVLESQAIHDYPVLILNYMNNQRPSLSDPAKANLLRYVDSGKGLVCFHFSAAAFRDWDAQYIPLIARAWREGSGHGPRGAFTVEIADREHPIGRGAEDFQTDDELYAKLVGDKPIHVVARAYSDWSQRVEPIAFVHSYGQGRVFNYELGHDVEALQPAPVRRLFARGTEWAATGDVKD